MTHTLVFVQDEGYLIWNDNEMYFRGGKHGMPLKLFQHMLKHKGEWREVGQIIPALWPAGSPPTAESCVRVHAHHVASTLFCTTALLEGRIGYGYRLTGEIEVI